MEWCKEILEQVKFENISNEDEKKKIAQRIAQKVKDGEVIGFGSGSTSYLAVKEIGKKIKEEKIKILAIPTSYEIKMLCTELEIPTTTIMEHKPDWCFDGADEVDANNWLIKGRGAAMFKEKLNFLNSSKVYILVDKSKFVKKIGEKHPIPVECYPSAIEYVKERLMKLGAKSCTIREQNDKLVYTDSGNLIIDTWFDADKINKELENDIKLISGVIESGLFIEYKNVEIL